MNREIIIPSTSTSDDVINITFDGKTSYRIVAEKGAGANVMIDYLPATGDENLTNHASFELAENTGIDIYHLQNMAQDVEIENHFSIKQSKNAVCYFYDNALGAMSAQNNVDVELNETGATCVMQGVFITDGKQSITNNVVMRHNAPHTHSNQNYKGIAQDSSNGNFFTRVIVSKNAQKISSTQSNKNLLLSKTATIKTKPELEIYADDVKCAHGATVGEVDANALFYLRSRGLSQSEAFAMLIYAFIAENIDHKFKSQVQNAVLAKIPNGREYAEQLEQMI